jgi:hypothetical protein
MSEIRLMIRGERVDLELAARRDDVAADAMRGSRVMNKARRAVLTMLVRAARVWA